VQAFIAENSGALLAGAVVAGIVLSVVVKLLRDRKQKRAPCCGGCACRSKHAAGVLPGS
jgi:hypothetical protein